MCSDAHYDEKRMVGERGGATTATAAETATTEITTTASLTTETTAINSSKSNYRNDNDKQ